MVASDGGNDENKLERLRVGSRVAAMVVVVLKAMVMVGCCLQGERTCGQRNLKPDMARGEV
jgi:hypothetical protein